MKMTINNKSVKYSAGDTILTVAKGLGIDVPTMCYLDGYPHNTSCMICVVEDKETGKLIPSCSAPAREGMEIETDNERVFKFRKDAIDLLLSEHVGDCDAPCQRVCPALMDIPLMIRQIQRKEWGAAIRTVKADIALPAVLGRICPAPCENGCNRDKHDTAVSICTLKRYVADRDLDSESYMPACEAPSGKTVAIVGAGPAGLAAAYYLQQCGHQCTIFDKNKQPGGNLRYAVPDDRLPKDVLDAEIEQITRLGVELKMGVSFGKDIALDSLQNDFNAVVLATGDLNDELCSNTPLESSKRGVKIDRKSLQTTIPGVFAGGSLVSSSQMAVRAVAHGKILAISVDQYLKGQDVLGRSKRFNSLMGRLQEGESVELLKEASESPRLEPAGGFGSGFSEEEAIDEALRCFHCDCRKQENCKLRLYSDIYSGDQKRYKIGARKKFERQVQHELVVYESGKCIKCGLCVQIAARAGEKFGFTFINRGFDVKIAVPFDEALDRGLEKVARECAEACPTAAISLKQGEKATADLESK
jgi:ferredoxin